MRGLGRIVAASLFILTATSVGAARAAVVFSDNFNSYAEQLNWAPPANWTVTAGSVDLIGETTSGTDFDLYPGNGGYVDMEGSTQTPGTLQTISTFGPGTYTVHFDLGGNARGDVDKTTVVTLGGFSHSITLASNSPLTLYSFTFTTAAGGALSFSDLPNSGNQNIGNILDDVSLETGVPEPATWALMLLGVAGAGAALRRRARGAAAALA